MIEKLKLIELGYRKTNKDDEIISWASRDANIVFHLNKKAISLHNYFTKEEIEAILEYAKLLGWVKRKSLKTLCDVGFSKIGNSKNILSFKNEQRTVFFNAKTKMGKYYGTFTIEQIAAIGAFLKKNSTKTEWKWPKGRKKVVERYDL